MLSLSLEKPSFLSLLVIGLAQARSGFPHFTSTISTMFILFSLLGVPCKDTLSEPSIGSWWVLFLALWLFGVLALSEPTTFGSWWVLLVMWPFGVLTLLLLLASSDDFLALGLLGVEEEVPQSTETGIVVLMGLVVGAWGEGCCFMESSSRVIRVATVPVAPILMDPPPPLISSSFWAIMSSCLFSIRPSADSLRKGIWNKQTTHQHWRNSIQQSLADFFKGFERVSSSNFWLKLSFEPEMGNLKKP